MTKSAAKGRRVIPFAQPRGREQVRAALIRSASELFAERGPVGVSVRDVAAHAGVNHGLVHQYFGSKQALLGEVLEFLAGDISQRTEEIVDVGGLLDATAANPFWRVLARTILDGEDLAKLQKSFPTVGRIVDFFTTFQAHGRLDDFDPKILSAMVVALGLGWLLFEPFVIPAAQLSDRPADGVREEFRRTALEMVARLMNDPSKAGSTPAAKKRKAD
jgi:TetR/AcrR family transcriptional regulator, repressor for neighboring sulfatase